jgi:hypothetical protein
MKSICLLTGICCLAIMFAACSSATDPSSRPYFPNTIGTTWIYEVDDSLAGSTDTVTVTVIGSAMIDSSTRAMLWQYRYPSRTDTETVWSSGDTIRMARFINGRVGWGSLFLSSGEIILPLATGKGWSLFSGTDSVAEQGTISVPAGIYSNGYHLEGWWYMTNEGGHNRTWFVPYVGIVSMERWQRLWTEGVNERWILIAIR